MLTALQLEPFYPDLSDPRYPSALALVHSRFSTNTFPSWPLAHPYRIIAHNGEINTIRGNRNWMRAREALLATDLIAADADGRGIERLLPILDESASDSASFDACLELLHLGGRSLPHAVLMMIPEPWENNEQMDPARRAFYRFHASLMEPWDGPALIAFTDGTVVGAVLDRNGLRPGRYWVTEDGLVVLASEVGVLDLDPATVVRKGRLQPGRIFLADTAAGRIIEDEEVKAGLAAEHPYAGLAARRPGAPGRAARPQRDPAAARGQAGHPAAGVRLHRGGAAGGAGAHGPHRRRAARLDGHRHAAGRAVRPAAAAVRLLHPAVRAGHQPAAGRDPGGAGHLAGVATSGRSTTCFDPGPASCRQVVLPYPVISDRTWPRSCTSTTTATCPASPPTWSTAGTRSPMAARPAAPADEISAEVSAAIAGGARIIVLSDRACPGGRPAGSHHAAHPWEAGPPRDNARLAPIPSLLLTGAVHHHLIRERTRTRAGLIVESGDARECHHIALLIGYGAAAVCPYLAIESVEDWSARGALTEITDRKAVANLIKALGKGVLKIMSKMGVSTVASYTGAQIFEAVGLGAEVIGDLLRRDVVAAGRGRLRRAGRRDRPRGTPGPSRRAAPARRTGGWRPAASTSGGARASRTCSARRPCSSSSTPPAAAARRLPRVHPAGRRPVGAADDAARAAADPRRDDCRRPQPPRLPVPLDEVEPVAAIVRRFATGAMSYGSISAEAHETLAIAMNRLGGRSNTGEGGEDAGRFVPDENGDLRRSAVKQVASGRFGVTSEYLVNADDLQIKMAQGAKPGEGGQLPGHKVYPWIAATRHSTPGRRA